MDCSRWTVSDVAKYLSQIGLGQYSQSFIQNDISGLELPYLTDEYLVELGVNSIGHRIKIKNFIKTINNINNFQFPPLNSQVEERDTIHPLSQNIFQELYIQSELGELPGDLDSEMKECQICHRMFHKHIFDYHQKVCGETFIKCKNEFALRDLKSTDEDIVDLLSGKVPASAIKLQKCKFCHKKFLQKYLNSIKGSAKQNAKKTKRRTCKKNSD